MDAVKWDDAATAAADGSRLEFSAMLRFSGIDCGRWVGELLLGPFPSHSRFVENLRDKLLPEPFCSVGMCVTTGDMASSWFWKSGLWLLGWYGKGCDRSLATRMIGRTSSLNLRKSAAMAIKALSALMRRSSLSMIDLTSLL